MAIVATIMLVLSFLCILTMMDMFILQCITTRRFAFNVMWSALVGLLMVTSTPPHLFIVIVIGGFFGIKALIKWGIQRDELFWMTTTFAMKMSEACLKVAIEKTVKEQQNQTQTPTDTKENSNATTQ